MNFNIGDKVKDSPIGPGEITGVTSVGYPQVKGIAVAWLTMADGTFWDGIILAPKLEIPKDLGPRVKVDFDANGKLDEIFISDENGDCIFHLEKMTESHHWMRIYSTKASPMKNEIVLHANGLTSEFEEPDNEN